jgi:fumarate reductase subunit C
LSSAEIEAEAPRAAPRVYRRPMPAGWWTRNGHYFWYVVREFTSLPLALWLLWLLYDIRLAGVRPVNFHPTTSPAFVVFSVIVLLFALYHSFTFLSLAGVIIHIKVADRPVPSRLIVLSQFAMWAAASVVVGFVLIWFAR